MTGRRSVTAAIAGAALLFAALACNSLLPQGVPGFPTENPYLEVPRVTPEEAIAAYNSGAAVFVDVRGTDQYSQSHIAGALSIPLTEIEARIGELDPNDWIITYCT